MTEVVNDHYNVLPWAKMQILPMLKIGMPGEALAEAMAISCFVETVAGAVR